MMNAKSAISPSTASEIAVEQEVKALFQKYAIKDIRQRHENAQKEVDQKRQELRKLVGTRYRDLIDAADSIIQMQQLVQLLHQRLDTVDDQYRSLSHTRTEQAQQLVNETEDVSSVLRTSSKTVENALKSSSLDDKQRYKLQLGRQLKVLIDTPEQIWSAIEQKRHLKATSLYLAAESIYASLQHAASTPKSSQDTGSGKYTVHMLEKIPLLQRQWGSVRQFPPKIIECANAQLFDNFAPIEFYGGSLAALVLLQKKSIQETFDTFLQARLESFKSFDISTSSDGDDHLSAFATKLFDNICLVIETINQVIVLFSSIDQNQSGNVQSKVATNNNNHISSKSKGGAIEKTTDAMNLMELISEEEKTIKAKISSSLSSDSTFQFQYIQSSCDNFISQCRDIMKSKLEAAMASIFHAKDIALLQYNLLSLLYDKEKCSTTDLLLQRLPVSEVTVDADESAEPSVESPNTRWRNLYSQIISHKDVTDLWPLFFGENFTSICRGFIQRHVQKISIQADVTGYLHVIAGFNPSTEIDSNPHHAQITADLNLGRFVWRGETVQNILSAVGTAPDLHKPSSSSQKHVHSEANRDLALTRAKAAAVSPKIHDFVLNFDKQLSLISSDLNFLTNSYTRLEDLKNSLGLKADSSLLKSHFRSQCLELISSFCESRRSELMYLEKEVLEFFTNSLKNEGNLGNVANKDVESHWSSVSRTVMKAVFLGRLCAALGEKSLQLPEVLVKKVTIDKRAPLSSRRTPSRATKVQSNTESDPSMYKSAQELLHNRYLHAYSIWVCYVINRRCGEAELGFRSHNWENDSLSLTWKTVKVDSKDTKEDVKLPTSVSPFVDQFLFGLCQEIHHAGSHSIDSIVLRYAVYSISRRMSAIYVSAADDFINFSRDSVIQILFDMSFLFHNVFSWTKEKESVSDITQLQESFAKVRQSATEATQASSLSTADQEINKWNATLKAVFEKYESKIDAIDLAFYRPLIHKQVEQSYMRSMILYGAICKLQNHKQTNLFSSSTSVSSSDSHNLLTTTSLVGRFSLLPVSAPTSSFNRTSNIASVRASSLRQPAAGNAPATPSYKATLQSLQKSEQSTPQSTRKITKSLFNPASIWFL